MSSWISSPVHCDFLKSFYESKIFGSCNVNHIVLLRIINNSGSRKIERKKPSFDPLYTYFLLPLLMLRRPENMTTACTPVYHCRYCSEIPPLILSTMSPEQEIMFERRREGYSNYSKFIFFFSLGFSRFLLCSSQWTMYVFDLLDEIQ